MYTQESAICVRAFMFVYVCVSAIMCVSTCILYATPHLALNPSSLESFCYSL